MLNFLCLALLLRPFNFYERLYGHLPVAADTEESDDGDDNSAGKPARNTAFDVNSLSEVRGSWQSGSVSASLTIVVLP